MSSLWHNRGGRLTCSWSEIAQRVQYRPDWPHENSEAYCGFLPKALDFASHSPFGSADWFEPHWLRSSVESESRP